MAVGVPEATVQANGLTVIVVWGADESWGTVSRLTSANHYIRSGDTLAPLTYVSHETDASELTVTFTCDRVIDDVKPDAILGYVADASAFYDENGQATPQSVFDSVVNGSTATATTAPGGGFYYACAGTSPSALNAGSDSNVGTTGAPFATITTSITKMASGDRLYLDGRFHERNIAVAKSRVAFLRHANATRRPQIRGDVLVSAGSWTHAGSNVYTAVIGAGLTIFGVTQKYGVLDGTSYNVAADGGWYGHLQSGATSSAMRWSYAGDTLSVHLYNDEDPRNAGVPVTYCLGGNGFAVSGTDVTISGIDGVLYIEYTAQQGIPFKNNGGVRTVFDDLNCYDSGYHPVSHQDNTGSDGIMRNCTNWGSHRDGNGSGSFVFHATNGAGLTGFIGENITNYCRAPICADGTTYLHSYDVSGFYAHTSGTNFPAGAVLWRNCRAIYYTGGASGNPFTANQSATPADYTDWNTYPIRAIGCTITNAPVLILASSGAHMAFAGCRIGLTGNNATVMAAYGTLISVAAGSYICLQDCEIRTNITAVQTTQHMKMLLAGSGSRVALRNCSHIESSTGSHGSNGNMYYIGFQSQAGYLHVTRCIFQRPACTNSTRNYVFANDDNVSLNRTISYNWYPTPITPNGRYSTKDSNATFIASTDPNGVFETAASFTDYTTSAIPTPGGNLHRRRVPPPNDGYAGLNGVINCGTIGAYQYLPQTTGYYQPWY